MYIYITGQGIQSVLIQDECQCICYIEGGRLALLILGMFQHKQGLLLVTPDLLD